MRMTTPWEVRMRGDDRDEVGAMWSYVPMEQRIPAEHPLRVMRPLVDGVLRELSPRFGELYSRVGRPSIAPEKLLRALLLRSEEHTSELQSLAYLVCRLLLEKKKNITRQSCIMLHSTS